MKTKNQKPKQPSEVFIEKAALKHFAIFTENTCVGVSF